MRATTIWQAYRRAHALSSLHLWDKKVRRNELAFLARLEKIISEYDKMKAEKKLPRLFVTTARTVA